MGSSSVSAMIVVAAIASSPVAGEPVDELRPATNAIDVEFGGLQLILQPDPDDPSEDLITYGDEVRGKFRIWLEDAPAPNLTSRFLDMQDARIYGRDAAFHPGPASFVTSKWLSPLPSGFTGNVGPFPGGVADDSVTIGDAVRFEPDAAPTDWFVVSDNYTRNFDAEGERHNRLFIRAITTRDILRGVALDQEFHLTTPVESGEAGYGAFQQTLESGVRFFEFAVEIFRVIEVRVCRP